MRPFGSNHIRAVLRGNQGTFYVNGVRVAQLNLGGVTHAGAVGVFTGYYSGHDLDTHFSNFQGTSLDRVPLSLPTEDPLDIGDKQTEASTEFEARDPD